MPRMTILNTVEREAFNSPPVFSSFQRKQYFDFPSKLRRFAAGLRNRAYQLGFLLSAGYFKAARRFFSPGSFHPRDIEYVARQLEPGAPTVDFAQYHPRARQRHQHTIRTFYGFRACDSAASRLLLKEIAGLVRSQVKPKVIFWRCIDVLVREKIEVPSYTRLTKLILGAINRRSQELAAIIERSLTQEVRALLEDLLTQERLGGPRQNQRLQAHPDEKTLAINQTLQGQRAGSRFEVGWWPLRSTEPNPFSPSHSCREGSGTTPKASSARRSSSSRAGMTPIGIEKGRKRFEV